MCHPADKVEVAPGVALTAWAATQAPLAGIVAAPVGQRRGTVLLIPDVTGVSDFYRGLASQLATAGFRAVVPDLYADLGAMEAGSHQAALDRQARLDEALALRHVEASLAELADDGERLGVVGFCFGGTMALDLAAAGRELATVVFYGFPGPTPLASDRKLPQPLELASRIRGPLLGLWGDQDLAVDVDNVHRLRSLLVEHGTDHEIVIYPGLGHSFLRLAFDPGDAEPTLVEQAAHAWARALAFLADHVGRPA